MVMDLDLEISIAMGIKKRNKRKANLLLIIKRAIFFLPQGRRGEQVTQANFMATELEIAIAQIEKIKKMAEEKKWQEILTIIDEEVELSHGLNLNQ